MVFQAAYVIRSTFETTRDWQILISMLVGNYFSKKSLN